MAPPAGVTVKTLLSVVLVIAAALAVIAVSVFAGHDRSVLVAPPDAVSEGFVRQLAMDRYDLAHRFLARDLKAHASVSDLRRGFEPLRRATGKPDQVEATAPSISGERARVLVTLEGRQATASMYVDLIREQGVWKITTWPLDVVQKP